MKKNFNYLHHISRWLGQYYGCWCPGPHFNMKMKSYQYRKSHYGDKTILRPSYLHNGISYTGKTTFQYWIRTQAPYVPQTSAAMVLTTQDKEVLIFRDEECQLPASSQFWEVIQNVNIFFMFSKISSSQQWLLSLTLPVTRWQAASAPQWHASTPGQLTIPRAPPSMHLNWRVSYLHRRTFRSRVGGGGRGTVRGRGRDKGRGP